MLSGLLPGVDNLEIEKPILGNTSDQCFHQEDGKQKNKETSNNIILGLPLLQRTQTRAKPGGGPCRGKLFINTKTYQEIFILAEFVLPFCKKLF